MELFHFLFAAPRNSRHTRKGKVLSLVKDAEQVVLLQDLYLILLLCTFSLVQEDNKAYFVRLRGEVNKWLFVGNDGQNEVVQ